MTCERNIKSKSWLDADNIPKILSLSVDKYPECICTHANSLAHALMLVLRASVGLPVPFSSLSLHGV